MASGTLVSCRVLAWSTLFWAVGQNLSSFERTFLQLYLAYTGSQMKSFDKFISRPNFASKRISKQSRYVQPLYGHLESYSVPGRHLEPSTYFICFLSYFEFTI